MILDQFSLKGKVAVVTGSNTGLGQGISKAFVEAGAKVLGEKIVELDIYHSRPFFSRPCRDYYQHSC